MQCKRNPVRPRRRRGVLLLVVLSLLVLFVLAGLTFIVVTQQYRRVARQVAAHDHTGDSPPKLVDKVFYDLLRDTQSPSSAMRGHSLLRDYYGEDYFLGLSAKETTQRIHNNAAQVQFLSGNASGGEFIDVVVVPASLRNANNNPVTPEPIFDYYGGRLLTFTSGSIAGLSARIVGSGPTSGDHYYFRLLVPRDGSSHIFSPEQLGEQSFIINGRIFNGTGFGFKPGEPDSLDRFDSVLWRPLALLPNSAQRRSSSQFDLYVSGGSDEGYDAVDFQNMGLALLPPDTANSASLIPSFHRPALINYWFYELAKAASASDPDAPRLEWSDGRPMPPLFDQLIRDLRQMATDPDDPSEDDIKKWTMVFEGLGPLTGNAPEALAFFKRHFILRPLQHDHPSFTGSNPNFRTFVNNIHTQTAWTSTWDVDNDGDGIPDSIWIDAGLPSQATSDGRLYKPLAAVLCVDLDGRLNLNAHGTARRVQNRVGKRGKAKLAIGTTGGSGSVMGLGNGPPEVRLDSVIPLMDRTAFFQSRYGADGKPGQNARLDLLARIKLFDEPKHYWNQKSVFTSFSSPSDLHGELEHGLDAYGQLTFESLPLDPDVNNKNDARQDSPYEVNLLQRQAADDLFSVNELEAVLRQYDYDASNTIRTRLADSDYILNNHRLVTTESFDPPVSGVAGGYIVDLMVKLLGDQTHLLKRDIAFNLRQSLLWPAMSMNLPLDINRPVGNGRDDNNDNIADDPMESQRVRDFDIQENTWDRSVDGETAVAVDGKLHPNFRARAFNHTNGLDSEDATLGRHFLARHLYVLMMALIHENDPKLVGKPLSDSTPQQLEKVRQIARNVAQWAINVVDFRDADSIMTPFEYDPTPFGDSDDPTGAPWAVDGRIDQYLGRRSTDDLSLDLEPYERDVVWGCERPELVITETLAFHDRRTEDLSADGGKWEDKDPVTGEPEDDDYDQRLVPRGSFFVELFNPWTSVSTRLPSELYDPDPHTGDLGVNLQRVSTDPFTGRRSPVWRLVVTQSAGVGRYDDPASISPASIDDKDPDHPIKTLRPDFERIVYFIDRNAYGGNLIPNLLDSKDYWTDVYSGGLKMSTIQPGRYVVIGSPGINSGGDFVTPIGRTDSDSNDDTLPELPSTRQIRLVPGNAASGRSQVYVENNIQAHDVTVSFRDAPTGITKQPTNGELDAVVSPRDNKPIRPAAIVVNQPRLSISEPVGGYPELAGLPDPPPGGEYELTSISNQPLDVTHGVTVNGKIQLTKNETIFNYRTVHLQRLANPRLQYHEDTNPYLTVDSLRCDITSFNGVDKIPSQHPLIAGKLHPSNEGADPIHFRSVQRGDQGDTDNPTTEPQYREFWPQEPNPTGPWPQEPATEQDEEHEVAGVTLPASHVFRFLLRHSIGYLNDQYWKLGTIPPTDVTSRLDLVVTPDNKAFGCLAWNNRPYVSRYELLNVPRTRSSHLLNEYSVYSDQSPYVNDDSREFGHLWNFFSREEGGVVNEDDELFLYRLFDYVNVPSRFVGTDIVLNPIPFSTKNGVTFGRLTPFNTVSNYRVPGLININTMTSPTIWNALTEIGGLPPTPDYDEIVKSRRGFTAYLPPPDETIEDQSLISRFLNKDSLPTYFANPFRPGGHGKLAPMLAMRLKDIDTTLLRPEGDIKQLQLTTNSTPDVLFKSVVSPSMTQQAITRDTRNSYFRYELLRRLGNMVTTRSNVYAIWITVGYFELLPNMQPDINGNLVQTVDAARPDGYQLGQELGSDTGEITRNRGFFIVDRTIPVAFEPGENHNVDDCVLLRRYIE